MQIKADKKINKILKNKFLLAMKRLENRIFNSILSVKSVKNVKVVAHILKYGTMHTDCIVSSDKKIAILHNKS